MSIKNFIKKLKEKTKSQKSGFVILFAVTLSSIILAITLGVANISLKEINFATSARDTNDAFFNADTGAECALFNDKTSNNKFPYAGPATPIDCFGETIPVTTSTGTNTRTYEFIVPDLGSTEQGCVKVTVLKDNNVVPMKTTITSRGYNLGDATCESTNDNRVERSLRLSFDAAPDALPPPDAPTESEGVFWVNPVLVQVSTNSLSKSSADAWNAGAVSSQRIMSGDGYAQFTATEANKYRAFGLTNNANVTSYNNITYGIQLNNDGTFYNEINGAAQGSAPWPTYIAGDVFRVAIESGVVKYRKNGTVVYTSVVAPSYPIRAGASLFSNGATITNASIYVQTTPPPETSYSVDYLVVGGGGGGGATIGGGGGGGGLRSGSMSLGYNQPLTVTVGAGGAGAPDNCAYTTGGGVAGGTSGFNGITAAGGGGGGSYSAINGATAGGSGGGLGAGANDTVKAGTAGQGFAGGTASANSNAGAGGGGSGGVGGNTGGAVGGAGGSGTSSSISGSSLVYSGGGGGGGRGHASIAGGAGGGAGGAGGANTNGVAGTANRGGGGGGGGYPATCGNNTNAGGAGGTGVVIIRYLGEQRATGGTITSAGGYTIHTFTTSGVLGTGTIATPALTVTKIGLGTGTVAGGPINCGATCNANINQDTLVTLTATPAAGSVFAGWTGACSGTGTCNVLMDSTKSVTANFNGNSYAVDYLVVGGGGGGGETIGGGGGGGGVLSGSGNVTASTNYTVTVGNGGAGAPAGACAYASGGGAAGGSSLFKTIIANGGGGGGNYNHGSNGATTGGSGGGIGAGNGTAGMAGTAGQGNAGGSSTGGNGNGGGGGGGAGGAGTNGVVSAGGPGGAGTTSSISGSSAGYGAGGGGGGRYGAALGGPGGSGGVGGGGGDDENGASGMANRGGGGGGGGYTGACFGGGNGGTGVVVVRYVGSSAHATGGTITLVPPYVVHTFTTSGTFGSGTPPPPDLTAPVVSSFTMAPNPTLGTVLASFTTTDAGGSHLQKAELWRSNYNDTNCTISVITGCSWSTVATSTAGVNATLVSGSNVSITGNSMTKNAGGDASWNAGAVSSQSITSGDGYVEFTVADNTTYKMAGLGNGNASNSYEDIEFAAYPVAGGSVAVYESGNHRGNFTTYVAGDIFRVAVVSGQVKYYKNGVLFYTSLVAPTYPLTFDSSLYALNGSTLNNIKISSGISDSWSSVFVDTPTQGSSFIYSLHSLDNMNNLGLESTRIKIDAGDYENPVVTAFNITPNPTTGPIKATFTATDAGGSHLNNANLMRAVASPSCSVLSDSGCSWSTVATSAAATNVTFANLVNITPSGNSLTGGGSGWDSGATSTQSITSGDGYVEFRAGDTTNYKMAGLGNGNVDSSYTDIEYAVYMVASGGLSIYQSGTHIGSFGSYAAGDIFRVAVVSGQVKYYKNGVLFYTHAAAPSYPLYFDSSFYPNTSVNDIKISSLVSDSWSGTFFDSPTLGSSYVYGLQVYDKDTPTPNPGYEPARIHLDAGGGGPVFSGNRIFLTSGTSWTVPSDWNSSNNTIEVIGGGGGGRTSSAAGGGGGGGAYSKITNLTLTPSASVTYSIGAGGAVASAGGDTYFNAGSCAGASVCAKGGNGATGATGATGGASASGVGTTKNSGGDGGNGGTSSNTGGGGGGGAAGPLGAGKNGGNSISTSQGDGGGGGGGNGGATAGGNSGGGASGTGGHGTLGSGGGRTGGYPGGSGTNFTAINGGGGFGGTPFNSAVANVSNFIHAGSGSTGLEWGSGNGSGGGGGGGASIYTSTAQGNGGAGGLYGGGGGGGATGGAGGQGMIVISYTPSPSFMVDTSGTLGSNLISYWKLNEASGTRVDSVSSRNLTDVNTVTSSTGKQGNAGQFTSANSEKLTVVDSADLSTGNISFSIAGWVYFDTLVAGIDPVVFKWEGSTLNREYAVYKNASNQLEFAVNNSSDVIDSVVSTTVSAGTWYHFVAWYNATADTLNLQINNGTVVSKSNTTGSKDSGATFVMGGYSDSTAYYHNGRIDEVGFWKKVLTTQEKTDLYNGGAGNTLGSASPAVATGGVISYVGGYKIHTFTSSGTLTVTSPGSIEYLIVGGGGGGGSDGGRGGGGGAGGLLTGSTTLSAQAYTVTVGNGGAGAVYDSVNSANGSSSTFAGLTALGGGRGGGRAGSVGGGDAGGNGGSGGGGDAYYTGAGGSGTSGQGLGGGTGTTGVYGAGGGGGAGGIGASGSGNNGGNGGVGLSSSITGAALMYAGGGGGGGTGTVGSGGSGGGGGGGNGTSPIVGTPNTGGGGGGASQGAAGGSGVVVVRYPTAQTAPSSNFTVDIGGNLENNLAAYWKMNETSGSRVDSKSSITLTDNNTVTSATGKQGNAGQFTKANTEYLSSTDNATLSTGDIDFSMAAWVYLDTKESFPILAKYQTGTNREYWFGYEPGVDRFDFYLYNAAGGGIGFVKADYFGAPSTSNWYLVYAEHNATNNTVGISVNNGPMNISSTTGAPGDTASNFYMGYDTSAAYNGRIDEVGFWKKALTAQERSDLYNVGGANTFNSTGGSGLSRGSNAGVPFGTTKTWTHTTSATDNLMLVFVRDDSGGVTSVTNNNGLMTPLSSTPVSISGFKYYGYYYINPTVSTAHTITVTTSTASIAATSQTYANVDIAAFPQVNSTITGTGNVSATKTLLNGSWGVLFAADRSGTNPTANTNATSLTSIGGGASMTLFDSNGPQSAGSFTQTANATGASGGFFVEIPKASSGGALAINRDSISTKPWNTTKSWSHTNNGNFLYVVVRSDADTVTGVTYNGVAMTSVDDLLVNSTWHYPVYYLVNPAIGTYNISVTTAGANIAGSAVSYKNVRTTNPIEVKTNGNPPHTVTTNTDKAWSVFFCADRTGTPPAPLTNTHILSQPGGGASMTLFDSGPISPAGSFTQNCTVGSPNNAIMYVIAPSGSSPLASLLLHADGSNGATTFIDNSGTTKTVIANGSAQVSTGQSKFGGASASFDGADTTYLSTPDSSDWDFGSGDFTIDFWGRFNSIGTYNFMLGTLPGGTDRSWIVTYITTVGFGLNYTTDGSTLIGLNSGWNSAALNTWYHFAVVRSGTNVYLFVNGQLQGGAQSIGSNVIYNSTSPLTIGRTTGSSNNFNGYIDELRIRKGVAVWTSNFTPPASPY